MSTAGTETTKSTGNNVKNLADVAKVSELKELGWNVVADEKARMWTAHEKAGDLRSIGPASSIGALYTQVKLAVGKPEDKKKGNGKADPAPEPPAAGSTSDEPFELKGEASPKVHKVAGAQPTLPNVKDAVIDDMRKAILELRENTLEILQRQQLQKEQQAFVKQLMHKFEDELSTDPDTGNKYFQAEMVIAELVIEEKEKVHTRSAEGR